jgi:hypothetical protein
MVSVNSQKYILENSLFIIKWRFNSTSDSDFYWDNFPEIHSCFELFVSQEYDFEEDNLSENEKKILAFDILRKLNLEVNRNR